MSSTAYGVYRDAMENIGWSCGTDVLCAHASVYVCEGHWACFGTMDLNNEGNDSHRVEVRLLASTMKAWDRKIVRLEPDGHADHASVSTMLMVKYPGNNTERKYAISIGVWIPPEDISDSVRSSVKMGRSKIIAMRLDAFTWEQSPGTHIPI